MRSYRKFFCSLFPAAIGFLFSSSGVFAESASTDKSEIAIKYLNALPADQKIIIWPNLGRTYEILSEDESLDRSVEKYKSLGSRPFYLLDFGGIAPQISIVSSSSNYQFQEDAQSISDRSNLLAYYKKFMRTAKLSADGCTAYKFLDRDTWVAVGIIIIGEAEINKQGRDSLDLCVESALDYISGFPLPVKYFEYLQLPDSEVRGLILGAIGQCAKEGSSDHKPPEITMDGVTALPSLNCIKKKVAK